MNVFTAHKIKKRKVIKYVFSYLLHKRKQQWCCTSKRILTSVIINVYWRHYFSLNFFSLLYHFQRSSIHRRRYFYLFFYSKELHHLHPHLLPTFCGLITQTNRVVRICTFLNTVQLRHMRMDDLRYSNGI